jgi:hypothetical protein
VIYEEFEEGYRLFNYATTELRRFMNEIEYDLYQVDNFGKVSNVLAIPKEKHSAFTTKYHKVFAN